MTWLQQNLGTIAAALLLAVLVILIVRKLRRDKRTGTCSCGGSCAGCAMKDRCQH